MSRLIRDDIDKFFEYNIDLTTKTLFMADEQGTDHSMFEYTIKGLHILDRTKPGDPINIIMNNFGGDWYHGMGIYDAIKLCSSEVYIKVLGYAMSMGSIILQAADYRYVAENSGIMLHYGGVGMDYTHTKDFLKHAEETVRINDVMEQIYLERMKVKQPRMTKQKLRNAIAFDRFLSAEQAVEWGLADEVMFNEVKG